jgi:hypothetical protein
MQNDFEFGSEIDEQVSIRLQARMDLIHRLRIAEPDNMSFAAEERELLRATSSYRPYANA